MRARKQLWQAILSFHTDREGFILAEQDNRRERTPRLDVPLSADLRQNVEKVREIYHGNRSGDLVERRLKLQIDGKRTDAYLFFFDGMTSGDFISQHVVKPLTQVSAVLDRDGMDPADFIEQLLLTQNAVSRARTFESLVEGVGFGGCGILADGVAVGFVADVKEWPKRGVEKPDAEKSVLGPQESFTELMRGNTAILRKLIRDPNLCVENVSVGRKSKTDASVLYIRNLANESLVEEVRRRLARVDADYILASEDLERFLEDSNLRLMPQIMETERPDRAAMALCDGGVVVLVNGSPYALLAPATFFSFLHTPDDRYLRLPYANFVAALRCVALAVSVLLPGLFIMICQYHHELIPTDLLYALESSFEKTPFPLVFELVMLEVAFELLREAEIKYPSFGGPSVGIVGGLILGQAAVSANIVSPIVIIVVAFTAVGSMSNPSYSMGVAFRMMRFLYVVLGASAGILGITVALFLHVSALCSYRSFGVRYFAPVGPRTREGLFKTLFVTRRSKYPSKPDYNNSKQERSERYRPERKEKVR